MSTHTLNIINLALVMLEDDPVQEVTETRGASRAYAVFDQALNSTLEAVNWRMNAARAVLAELAETPAFGWPYQFVLPADCLNIRKVMTPYSQHVTRGWGTYERRSQFPWTRESNRLLTLQEPPIELLYGRRMTESQLNAEAALSEMFAEAVACKIGHLAGKAITGEQGDAERMRARFYEAVGAAGAVSETQDESPQPTHYNDWIHGHLV